jgi:hypothetical protein
MDRAECAPLYLAAVVLPAVAVDAATLLLAVPTWTNAALSRRTAT